MTLLIIHFFPAAAYCVAKKKLNTIIHNNKTFN